MDALGFIFGVVSIGAVTIPEDHLLARGIYLCIVNTCLILFLFVPKIASNTHMQVATAINVIVSFWACMVRLHDIKQE